MVLDSMWNSGSQTMVSLGEYAEFLDVYLDGEKLVDVMLAELVNDMTVDDMKKLLVRENPGHEVTFKPGEV